MTPAPRHLLETFMEVVREETKWGDYRARLLHQIAKKGVHDSVNER